MREVLFRVRTLISLRGVRWWWLTLAAIAASFTWLPLLSLPGYELASAHTVLIGVLGLGLATHGARKVPRGLPSTVAMALVLTSTTVPALMLAVLRTRFGSPCDPFFNIQFVPVLVLPTALLVAALGALVARLTSHWWPALLLNVGFFSLGAVATVWPILFGPQAFVFNHFVGFAPGPLYDEDVRITSPLLWFRLATVLLALALSSRRVVGIVCAIGFVMLELHGVELGFRMNDEALAAALGGRVETDEFVLHYPRSYSEEEVARIVGDVSFRYAQNVKFFGVAPAGKVRVWWYRSPAEKQRLVGAANTQFAKPWRREVHVNDFGFPHPVIKHELVHAMAAPWGAPPFGVAASFGGWFPQTGVIEGLAVAADNPFDELTLHQWAAAMKKKNLLPDVATNMTASGFYASPPSRAYATAGSFLRYLADTHGREKLRELYFDGDFERAYGIALEKLAADYVAFLDTVPLDNEAVNQAFARFRRGSVFERPCAREVGRLSGEAREALATEPQRARELVSRCRALQPQEPGHVLEEALLLRRLGQLDAAATMLDDELKRLEHEPSPWAQAALVRADLAIELKDIERARELWRQAISKEVSPGVDRTARVRLDGAALDAVNGFFKAGDDGLKLLALRDAGDSVAVRYLLGRKLAQLHASKEALPYLTALLEEDLPASLKLETKRLAIEAAFDTGRCDLVRTLATEPRFDDWVERCAFAFP